MRNDRRAMGSSTLVLAVLYGLSLGVATGCQQYAKITWDPPQSIEVTGKTPLAVGDLAQDRRKDQTEVIGKHTFTVFAIPVSDLKAHGTTPVRQSFDQAVKDALEAAGYELVEAERALEDCPVLRGEVNTCWWWSYTWLWPFVLEGGQNKVTLFLENRDGTVLWQHEFSRMEPGLPFGGAYAFDLMIKWSMSKLVQDIARECSSDGFKTVLRKGSALVTR